MTCSSNGSLCECIRGTEGAFRCLTAIKALFKAEKEYKDWLKNNKGGDRVNRFLLSGNSSQA